VEFTGGLLQNPMVTNVLLIYKRIADDIKDNTHTAPTFQDGLKIMELIMKLSFFPLNK